MIDYCFVPNLDNPQLLSVRLKEGKHAGTVFTLHKVRLVRDELGPHFTTDIKIECVLVRGKAPSFFNKLDQAAFENDVNEVVEHILRAMMDNFAGNEEIPEDSDE